MIADTVRTVILAVLLALATPAAAQDSASYTPVVPVLKAAASVSSDIVRIGDLVANAGVVADVAIFRAPDLGSTGMVPTALGGFRISRDMAVNYLMAARKPA